MSVPARTVEFWYDFASADSHPVAQLIGRRAADAHVAVRWRPQGTGFVFDGLPGAPLPTTWLEPDTQSVTVDAVLLGPDPIVAPARIHLSQNSAATGLASPRVQVVTDGLRPFRVEVGE